MILHKPNHLFFLFLLLVLNISYAQTGVVSGVLADEFGPVADINIIIKGANEGVVTDFDGNYAIKCKVGDVLIFNHLSYTKKEVTVTRKMFGHRKARNKKVLPTKKQKSVNFIYNDAYKNAINKQLDSVKKKNTNFFKNGLTYRKNKKKYTSFYGIKSVKQKDSTLSISYYDQNIYYKIDYISSLALQFISNKTTPKLQDTYVQGRPFNGSNQWFGAETNEVFSFGPNRNTLQFNNENYSYDTNGLLVPSTNTTGILSYKNNVFKASQVYSHGLTFAVRKGTNNHTHFLNLNLFNKKRHDIFNTEQSKLTQFDVKYILDKKYKFSFKHSEILNKQPNTNGFLNNVILTNYITPISFQNSQAYLFSNLSQRSFSNQFNNPLWLLNLHKNQNKTTNAIYNFNSKFTINYDMSIHANLSFIKNNTQFDFALPKNTIGFEDGYRSHKAFSENQFNAQLIVDLAIDLGGDFFRKVSFNTVFEFRKNQLNYHFLEQSGFLDLNFLNPINNSVTTQDLNDTTIHFSNEAKIDLGHWSILTLKNNALLSKIQGSELFLPSVQYYIKLNKLFGHPNWLRYSTFALGFSKEANNLPLYYQNNSHQSLGVLPQQSSSFLANNDLFNSKNLDFETSSHFEVETSLNIIDIVEVGFRYYTSTTKDAVFPILENNEFTLQNIANSINKGIEANLGLNIGRRWDSDFQYFPKFIFSKNNTEIRSLKNNQESFAIAGFSNVSKNLIVGEQAGTIVGTAYLRNQNGDKIIDNQGFPIVNSEKQIIGNTTPNFNLSFSNEFRFKQFSFHFLFNYQDGGDVWLGTQNVLNYFGRSEETARLRTTENFIFSGVNQQGNLNTIPVAFANPNQDINQNRWVRYGYSGVAEDAIVDGTYLNLKTINLSYNFKTKLHNTFIKQLKISLYANNLLTYTKTKGITPNSSLYDYSSSDGLDYFNTPLVKEIGFKINLKL